MHTIIEGTEKKIALPQNRRCYMVKGMDKRKDKRFKTRQFAKVCGKLGVVNDVSDNGIQISTALSPKNRKVEISFESSGRMIQLMGVIQWIKRRQQVQALNELGVVIKSAPPEFLQYVSTCQT
jgi:hypothetical protein